MRCCCKLVIHKPPTHPPGILALRSWWRASAAWHLRSKSARSCWLVVFCAGLRSWVRLRFWGWQETGWWGGLPCLNRDHTAANQLSARRLHAPASSSLLSSRLLLSVSPMHLEAPGGWMHGWMDGWIGWVGWVGWVGWIKGGAVRMLTCNAVKHTHGQLQKQCAFPRTHLHSVNQRRSARLCLLRTLCGSLLRRLPGLGLC